ncbi:MULTISPECIES: hypothetical protein [Pseudomonas]|nr:MULTISPECIES: hypothetical protein [Pseudomonas]WHS54968.1 hypothetical protein QLH64_03040 [Pseudomonas brassicacearum]
MPSPQGAYSKACGQARGERGGQSLPFVGMDRPRRAGLRCFRGP